MRKTRVRLAPDSDLAAVGQSLHARGVQAGLTDEQATAMTKKCLEHMTQLQEKSKMLEHNGARINVTEEMAEANFRVRIYFRSHGEPSHWKRLVDRWSGVIT